MDERKIKMATLKELKDWLEQGGKICRESSKDIVYDLTEEEELRDMYDGTATYQSLIASDWIKVEENLIRYKPKELEYFCYICDEVGSGICKTTWTDNISDINLYKSYNCFKTREEAEQARALWLAERELRSLTDEGTWFIAYNSDEDTFVSCNRTTYKYCPYRFSTEEKADAAIKQLGKDKLKLIYGVK